MDRNTQAKGSGAALSCAALIGCLLAKSSAVMIASVGLVSIANAQDDYVLEEIIVVATRREESMQDVAVAVTAITGNTLVESGVTDIYSMQEQAPALVVSRSQQSTTASFAIRGVGTSSQNFGLESSVGLYVDGVYRSRQSSMVNNLVDIQVVEVLRGPQGTLFGKNTPSGAVLIRTVAPTDGGRAANDANAFLEATAGDYGLWNINAASNIPLIQDTLALRATIFSSQRDGYVNELTAGSDVINDIDRLGGRLQLFWSPSDRLRIKAIADYSEIDEVCCAALTRQDNITATDRDDGMGGPVFGSDAVMLALGGTVYTGEEFDQRNTALNVLPNSTNEDSGLSVEINWDLATSTLTSISAIRQFESTDFIDADFIDVDLIQKLNIGDQSSFSQEFRIDGDWGERAKYVAGFYYFTQDLDSDSTLTAGTQGTPFLLGGNPAAQGVFDLVNGISLATGGLLAPAGLPLSPVDTYAREQMKQEHRSWAVFGQVDFDLTDSLVLTAGLRYTDEKKDLTGTFLEGPLGPPVDLVAVLTEVAIFQSNPAGYNPFSPESLAAFDPIRVTGWGVYLPGLEVFAPVPDINETLSDDQVSGTLKLSWFATDTTMLYASYGTGYKSGGTNTDRLTPGLNPIFGPETSEAFELGMKSQFANDRVRLNVAVHKTDVDDLQANAFTGTGFNLSNAGRAETHGAEIEMMWAALNWLDLQANYTWTVAEYADFPEGACWAATPFHTGIPDPGRANPLSPQCDRSGGRLPDFPEHNLYLMANFAFQVGDSTILFFRPEVSYYSDTMTDGNNDPLKLRDSYSIWNLRAGLTFENWDADLTLWGRNLTDEPGYQTVFDVPLQPGKLNAYPYEPRTYGVTFRKNF